MLLKEEKEIDTMWHKEVQWAQSNFQASQTDSLVAVVAWTAQVLLVHWQCGQVRVATVRFFYQ